MLAPKVAMKVATVNVAHSSVHLGAHPGVDVEITKEPIHPGAPQVHTHSTQERLDKLFDKLDLTGTQGFSDKERLEVKNLFNRMS